MFTVSTEDATLYQYERDLELVVKKLEMDANIAKSSMKNSKLQFPKCLGLYHYKVKILEGKLRICSY